MCVQHAAEQYTTLTVQCVHTHACMHARMHTCTHLRLHTCTLARLHTCTHAHLHTCTLAHMHALPSPEQVGSEQPESSAGSTPCHQQTAPAGGRRGVRAPQEGKHQTTADNPFTATLTLWWESNSGLSVPTSGLSLCNLTCADSTAHSQLQTSGYITESSSMQACNNHVRHRTRKGCPILDRRG